MVRISIVEEDPSLPMWCIADGPLMETDTLPAERPIAQGSTRTRSAMRLSSTLARNESIAVGLGSKA